MKAINFIRPQFLPLLLLCCLNMTLEAQINYSDFIPSGERRFYLRPSLQERKVIAPAPIREADAKFSKRIIRCIDARQKMNKQIEWPRQPLNALLYAGLSENAIVPYRTDSMASFYNTTQFRARGGHEEIIVVCPTDDPEDCHDSVIYIDFDYTKIHKFWVMEDWIFDAKHSVFKPHIMAIAPIYKPAFGGAEGPEQPLCWIKMDDIRQLLTNTEMFNRYNDAARLSYDDFFQMRIFDSYIVYESNVFDNFINQFEVYENDPIGALLKSDEVKNDLFIFEHDLWQY